MATRSNKNSGFDRNEILSAFKEILSAESSINDTEIAINVNQQSINGLEKAKDAINETSSAMSNLADTAKKTSGITSKAMIATSKKAESATKKIAKNASATFRELSESFGVDNKKKIDISTMVEIEGVNGISKKIKDAQKKVNAEFNVLWGKVDDYKNKRIGERLDSYRSYDPKGKSSRSLYLELIDENAENSAKESAKQFASSINEHNKKILEKIEEREKLYAAFQSLQDKVNFEETDFSDKNKNMHMFNRAIELVQVAKQIKYLDGQLGSNRINQAHQVVDVESLVQMTDRLVENMTSDVTISQIYEQEWARVQEIFVEWQSYLSDILSPDKEADSSKLFALISEGAENAANSTKKATDEIKDYRKYLSDTDTLGYTAGNFRSKLNNTTKSIRYEADQYEFVGRIANAIRNGMSFTEDTDSMVPGSTGIGAYKYYQQLIAENAELAEFVNKILNATQEEVAAAMEFRSSDTVAVVEPVKVKASAEALQEYNDAMEETVRLGGETSDAVDISDLSTEELRERTAEQKRLNDELKRTAEIGTSQQSSSGVSVANDETTISLKNPIEEASFVIENAQENIREEIKETNQVIEGQVDLFDDMEEHKAARIDKLLKLKYDIKNADESYYSGKDNVKWMGLYESQEEAIAKDLDEKKLKLHSSLNLMLNEDKEALSLLTEEADRLKAALQPVQDIVNRISSNSSISYLNKDKGSENWYKGYAEAYKEIDDRLGELRSKYELTNEELEEYIALQVKAEKIMDAMMDHEGGVKGSGAKDKNQLKQWIEKSFARDLGLDPDAIYSGLFGNITDALYGGGSNSLFGDDGKKRSLRYIVADTFRYKGIDSLGGAIGAEEDAKSLRTINTILTYIKNNAEDISATDFSTMIDESSEKVKFYEKQLSEGKHTGYYSKALEDEKQRLQELIELQERLNQARGIQSQSNLVASYENSAIEEVTQEVQELTQAEEKAANSFVENEKKKQNTVDEIANSAVSAKEAIKDNIQEPFNQVRILEHVNAELEEERDNLKQIEDQDKRNEAAIERLNAKRVNYSKEVFDNDRATYDTDKLKNASSALNEFNTQLEKRNQFQERYKQLCDIITDSYVGSYSIDNGLYSDLDDFISGNSDMKELQRLSQDGIKGVATKEIEKLFRSVVNRLKSDGQMVSRMISSGEVNGDTVDKNLEEEENRLLTERQRLYDAHEDKLARINILQQEQLDLMVKTNDSQRTDIASEHKGSTELDLKTNENAQQISSSIVKGSKEKQQAAQETADITRKTADTVEQSAEQQQSSINETIAAEKRAAEAAEDAANRIVAAEEKKRKAREESAESAKTTSDIVATEEFNSGDGSDWEVVGARKHRKIISVTDSDTLRQKVYQDEIGRTFAEGEKWNRRKQEWEHFNRELTDYTKLEKEAIKYTNALALARADLAAEQGRSNKDLTVIKAINDQIDLLSGKLEDIYIQARIYDAEGGLLAGDSYGTEEYSYALFEQRVFDATEEYSAKLATKTAKQIRDENEKLRKEQEENDRKLKEAQSKARERLAAKNPAFKYTTAYQNVESEINAMQTIDDINKVKVAFNELDEVINRFKQNVKSSASLDPVFAALKKQSNIDSFVTLLQLRFEELGLSADKAKDKVKNLVTTAGEIKGIDITSKGGMEEFGEKLHVFNQEMDRLDTEIKTTAKQNKINKRKSKTQYTNDLPWIKTDTEELLEGFNSELGKFVKLTNVGVDGSATLVFIKELADSTEKATVKVTDLRKVLFDLASDSFDPKTAGTYKLETVDRKDVVNAYNTLAKNEEKYRHLSIKETQGTATNDELDELKKIREERKKALTVVRQKVAVTEEEIEAQKKYNDVQKKTNDGLKEFISQEQKVKEFKTEIKSLMDSSAKMLNDFATDTGKSQIDGFDAIVEQYRKKVEDANNKLINTKNPNATVLENYKKLMLKYQTELDSIVAGNIDSDDAEQKMRKLFAAMSGGTAELGKFNSKNQTLKGTFKDLNGELVEVTLQYDKLTKTIRVVNRLNDEQKGLWDKLKDKLGTTTKDVVKALMVYADFRDIIRYMRQGFEVVKELDRSLTEMRKVSDESVKSLKEFQKASFDVAEQVGATASEIQNSAADFMRLGYSLQEASELAQDANIYANVGDMEIDEATEHMISSIKAWSSEFENEVEASHAIIDRYNEIGNNFAITSADIGAAMERSAAALKAGGNTLNESLGLITAGNIIQQDAESTANALKVMSLRIRGSKTELEEMGESTDDLASSSSKLRDEIKALSGVDIMLDDDTYKSTAQIIQEIGKEFNKLTDVSQATLLEKLAGEFLPEKYGNVFL